MLASDSLWNSFISRICVSPASSVIDGYSWIRLLPVIQYRPFYARISLVPLTYSRYVRKKCFKSWLVTTTWASLLSLNIQRVSWHRKLFEHFRVVTEHPWDVCLRHSHPWSLKVGQSLFAQFVLALNLVNFSIGQKQKFNDSIVWNFLTTSLGRTKNERRHKRLASNRMSR